MELLTESIQFVVGTTLHHPCWKGKQEPVLITATSESFGGRFGMYKVLVWCSCSCGMPVTTFCQLERIYRGGVFCRIHFVPFVGWRRNRWATPCGVVLPHKMSGLNAVRGSRNVLMQRRILWKSLRSSLTNWTQMNCKFFPPHCGPWGSFDVSGGGCTRSTRAGPGAQPSFVGSASRSYVEGETHRQHLAKTSRRLC